MKKIEEMVSLKIIAERVETKKLIDSQPKLSMPFTRNMSKTQYSKDSRIDSKRLQQQASVDPYIA